jgi:hypothetical protein
MSAIGLTMIAAAVGMLFIARSRDGKVVPWLEGEMKQQLYGFAFVILLAVGFLLAIHP